MPSNKKKVSAYLGDSLYTSLLMFSEQNDCSLARAIEIILEDVLSPPKEAKGKQDLFEIRFNNLARELRHQQMFLEKMGYSPIFRDYQAFDELTTSNVPIDDTSNVPDTVKSNVPIDDTSNVPDTVKSNVPIDDTSNVPDTVKSNVPVDDISNVPDTVKSNVPVEIPSFPEQILIYRDNGHGLTQWMTNYDQWSDNKTDAVIYPYDWGLIEDLQRGVAIWTIRYEEYDPSKDKDRVIIPEYFRNQFGIVLIEADRIEKYWTGSDFSDRPWDLKIYQSIRTNIIQKAVKKSYGVGTVKANDLERLLKNMGFPEKYGQIETIELVQRWANS